MGSISCVAENQDAKGPLDVPGVIRDWVCYVNLWGAILLLEGSLRDLKLLRNFCIFLGAVACGTWLGAIFGLELPLYFSSPAVSRVQRSASSPRRGQISKPALTASPLSSRVISLPWGYVFLYFNLNFSMGGHQLNVLPDWVCYVNLWGAILLLEG